PNWLPGAVYYQIFPDRFNRGKDFDLKRLQNLCNYPERICHPDWDEPVDFKGTPETGYIACDFFGGSLTGIIEKLPYLQDFGVDAIYLNPVFRARSNHRYDTGDYEEIDPILGDNQDMKALCREAKEHGIRIILDGVFSHTGADSRYFNLLERYEETGAVQAAKEGIYSPYSSWYDISLLDGELVYDSWWGFEELPNVKEQDLSYQEYITGEEGVLKKWLDLGVSGWRLDVSDELPDSFIRALRSRVSREKPDAVILGEVWEEACSKHSYGSYRDFIFGRTHHQVMGYPFRKALLSFLRGDYDASAMLQDLERVRENYPLPAFYANLNLISSHDTKRAITVLAGQDEPPSREAQSKIRLDAAQRQKGEKLLRLAAFFQVCYPGAISIYYGDERALEGYSDPFNRATFPWDQPEPDLTKELRGLARLRNMPVLRTGFYEPLLAEGDLFVFARFLIEGEDAFGDVQEENTVLCFINRGSGEATVDLQALVKGFAVRAKEDCSRQEMVVAEILKAAADNMAQTGGVLNLAPQTGLLSVDGNLELAV
ncbi:MAG TPA: glycoside hydrolase family 13 protein, partial [Clostridiaceae bacterium]|nr:glycoside hydrolase family 13 protein [Clostridiaceae bacterium]